MKQNGLKKLLKIVTPIILLLLWIANVEISVLPDTHQSSAIGSMVYITFGTILSYTVIGIILVLKAFKTMRDKQKLIPCLVFSTLLLISLGIIIGVMVVAIMCIILADAEERKKAFNDKGVKNIFVPSLQSIAPKIYNCSKIRGLPDLVRNVVKGDFNIIEATLDKSAKKYRKFT